MALVELRPLSTGELLDKAFSLYRKHFLLFVGIMAVPALLPFLLNVLRESLRAGGFPLTPVESALVIVSAMVVSLAYLIAYAMALAATVFAVSDVYLGRPASIRKSFAQVRGKSGRVFWMFFLLSLAMGVGFLLLIVPGVLVAVWYSVAIPVAVIENVTPGPAFDRSAKLTKGRRGSIFLIFLLFFILSYGAALLFTLPAAILSAMWPGVISGVISGLASFVSSVLVGPLLTIALSLEYYDLRVRKEGFDLQLMLSAIEPGFSAAPPSASLGDGVSQET